MVEHYLHTPPLPTRNAPQIDGVSCFLPPRANILSNKVSNTRRFQRVERGIQRHVRTGELWFVGRHYGRVIWQRLGTQNLRAARAAIAMMDSNINGNHKIFIVVEGKKHALPKNTPVPRDVPLRRVRQESMPVESEAEPGQPVPHTRATVSGPVPTLEAFIRRWRQGKEGLKLGTLVKLDAHLNIMRRYVDTNRPVTEYLPQDIRDYLAKARADKDSEGGRRLKGQTLNTSIWRPLHDAFALAVEEEYLARNPMDSVKREKAEPIVREQLSWEEAERVLAHVKTRGNHDSYLELKFMWLLGVGQGEAKDIKGGAVDWEKNKISFIRQKTGKPYTVPIYPWAEEFIRTEIEPRLKHGKPLFVWRNPRKALVTACKNLTVASVDIRSLRRTLIVRLIQQKVDIRLIAKWQGHRDATLILQRYGNYIDAEYEAKALATLKANVELGKTA